MSFANEVEKPDPVEISDVEVLGDWQDVLSAARVTMGKEDATKEPSNFWKKKILRAEHSPIRRMFFKWKWENLPSFVSVHFVRHKHGIEHFVKSQRTDRTGVLRNKLPQDAPVTHSCMADTQALINASRVRLCMKADPETRQAWKMLKQKVHEVDPIVAQMMVPNCVYRRACPEMECCNWCYTSDYEREMHAYWSNEKKGND